MPKRIVRKVVDLANPGPLTKEEEAELEALLNRPEDQIDFTDIPELTDDFFKNAVRNPFLKPKKTAATLRIDSDVLAWFKRQGKGYQTRINAVLRREMLTALKS